MRAMLLALLLPACGATTDRYACDADWDRCVETGNSVECLSSGAESVCTCQGTLDGKLAALACKQ